MYNTLEKNIFPNKKYVQKYAIQGRYKLLPKYRRIKKEAEVL